MGVGVLDLSNEAAIELPDRLREAGFAVEITVHRNPERPGAARIRVRRSRGTDVLLLGWAPSPDRPGHYRLWYQVPWALWPSTHRRQRQLMEDVVAIVVQSGGYWPFPE